MTLMNSLPIDINIKGRSSKFYSSVKGRTLTLLKSAKRRDINSELDFDYLYNKLLKNKCEVTGILFDLNKNNKWKKNPYSPSIDRINNKIGYTKENTRIVIWQYNLMKGELTDSELLDICKILTNK